MNAASRVHSSGRRSATVIGGGLIGLNVALALQERQFSVRVIDRSAEEAPASWGHAGRIATELVDPLASWKTLRSLPAYLLSPNGPVSLPFAEWPHWLPFSLRLARAALPQNFSRGQEALRSLLSGALPAWRRRLDAVGRKDLMLETAACSVWESARLSAAGQLRSEPQRGSVIARDPTSAERQMIGRLFSSPFSELLCFDGTAQISDPGELLLSLETAFEAGGGTFTGAELACLPVSKGDDDIIVVAAGVGSADLLRRIGHKVPLIAERGYHVQFDAPEWPFGTPSITFEDRSMVVTRFKRICRATSFVEFAHENRPPDPRKWRALARHLKELGILTTGPMEHWMGCRPTLPDYLPAIGQSRRAARLFYAFGHQHLGLTLAAVTGELTADLVTGRCSSVDLSPFDLRRFER